MTKRGINYIYTQPIDVDEFNYGPYVQQMKDKGVEYVQWLGSYQHGVRLAQEMQKAGFKPDLFLFDPVAYDAGFVESGGSAVDGAISFMNFVPFEEASSNAEMQLYLKYLQQVNPGREAVLLRRLRLVGGATLRHPGPGPRRKPRRRVAAREDPRCRQLDGQRAARTAARRGEEDARLLAIPAAQRWEVVAQRAAASTPAPA